MNFERTRVRRSLLRLGNEAWTLDTIEESSGSNQDRIGHSVLDGQFAIVLADGAGGTARGAAAADEAVAKLTSSMLCHPEQATEALRKLDSELASRSSGETTAIVIGVTSNGTAAVMGAGVGDSEAWARSMGSWAELTEGQHRKPLVGSGRARPKAFRRCDVDALLLASDGLTKYAKWPEVLALLDANEPDMPWRLVDLARLPSGGLQDDFSAVVLRRVTQHDLVQQRDEEDGIRSGASGAPAGK